MANLKSVIDALKKKTGTQENTPESLVKAQTSLGGKPVNRNLNKAAKVSRLAIYKTVQFTYVSGSRTGQTVFMRMSAFNTKRLGLTEKNGTVVTREVGKNKAKQVVKEELVMTQFIKISLGRKPKKRAAVTKGGRALRGGGRSVGGGISAYAKDWVSVPVPKTATAIDIIAHVESFTKQVYEIRYNGSSISLKNYPEAFKTAK